MKPKAGAFLNFIGVGFITRITDNRLFTFWVPYPIRAVLISSFLLRILGMIVFKTYENPLENEMGIMAANILAGDGMSIAFLAPERETTAFPPFESYFLALMHYLFGYSITAFALIISLRSALSVATAYVVYRFLRKIFSERLAFFSLVAIAFHPALFFYSSTNSDILRPPYSVLSVALIVSSMIWFAEHPSAKRSFLVGIVFGACCLIQSNVFSFIVFATLWLMYIVWKQSNRHLSWRAVGIVILMPIGAAIAISPWSVRNYLVSGDIVPVRSGFGTLFWAANNPMATGNSGFIVVPNHPKFDITGVETLSQEVFDSVLKASEIERDRILLGEALRYISQNPRHYFRLCAERFQYYWLGPHDWLAPPAERQPFTEYLGSSLYSIFSLGILILALSALFFRRDSYVALFFLVILNFTLLYSLVAAGFTYYRMDSEPYMMILALLTIESLWDRLKVA